ncbi:MAG: DUF402 domain-containing protein [Lachnospiraceae bacterium]|nr:DUF402 domain-containing protein [Lachnospiraceae bacterium]
MDYPKLYRKRLIPEECVALKDDVVLRWDDEVILTKWNALKPKKDLHHGYSCYFLREGYKVSKFYTADNTLLYWYCDIVDFDEEDADRLVVTDLLADVIIYPDGFVKVVDIDEMVTCLNESMISLDQLKRSLTQLDKLLQIIYADKFDTLTIFIEEEERKEEEHKEEEP